MLNSKVNNWAMELEAFNIQFDYIKGSSNILVDTLSRLIAIDPDTPTMPEEPGYEFGYAIFEEFPKVKTKTYEVNEIFVGTDKEIFKNDPELQSCLQCIENPIAPQRLKQYQQQDTNMEILKHKLQNNRLDKEYYSLDAQILLRSDHKPLEKFLLKNMLNSKVNNWAMELEAFNIQFDYIKGSSNILVDTLSRLIAIDPDTPTKPEEPGYEFGYAIFEEFPKVKTKTYEVNEIFVGTDKEIFKNDPELQSCLQCIENPIAPQRLKQYQQQDTNMEILKHKLQNNRLDKEYYSLDAQILLRSDHKPLEKFLLKNMLNSKVNNWAMELEAFNIQFDYIKGSSNILVDTLSRLIAIDPDTPTKPEEPGYEFGYAIFEEFPKVKTKTYEVNEIFVGTDKEISKNDPELQSCLQCIENPIAPQRLKQYQQQDTNMEILKHKLQNNRLDKEYYSLDENELLPRKVIDGGHKFHAIYLPSVLIFQVLWTAHDDLGHNGFPRTYAAIKGVFFWKGMKEDIRKHCKTCATCQLHKLENVKFERKIFKPSLQPMDFICMDLIGEFHPPTSCGHHYALTAVCMLTGFTWCVPLKTKTAEEVAKAYMDHIYCNFGGSIKILTDNGTEFKNKLFKEVISKLGTEFSIHSPPYRPQSNGKIEGFHRFLKMCIGKHINYGLEWDELTPMATACYNFFPNCSARESAFFVMFGRDPINKLNMLLHAARRYFHDDNGLTNLEVLKNIYQVVAQQLLNSRERYVKKHHNQQRSESPVQAGDLILIKDNTAKSFKPLYKGNYRVVKVHGNNVKIRDYRGNISMVHVTDMKKITLMEQVADEYEKLSKEGRFSKKCIP